MHAHAHVIQIRVSFAIGSLWLEKMSETSVKIIKNEVRCRDDTMPKTVDTRKHCKVGLRACNNLPQPPPYIFVFRGCGRLLHALNPTLQCFLVSTVFGTVSSLHLTSFLMIFTLVIHTVIAVMYYCKEITTRFLFPCLTPFSHVCLVGIVNK